MVMSIILLMVAVLMLVPLLLWYRQVYKYRNMKIPGPKPFPVVGNVFDIGTDISQIIPRLKQMQKKYGNIFKLYLGPTVVTVFISKPEYIKYFFNSNVHINKSTSYNIVKPYLGEGLATSNGETWRQKRRENTPAFHGTILENFTQTFNEAANRLINIFRATEGKHVDIHPYINEFAMDSITETALGLPFDDTPNKYDKYFKNLHKFMDLGMARLFSLYKMIDFLYKYTNDYKEQQECLKILGENTDKQIRQKIAERGKMETTVDYCDKSRKTAFLDVLLNKYTDDPNSIIEKIRFDVNTFIFAGHDTVTSSLSFMIYELTKHPDIQKKIYDEIDNVLGNNTENMTVIDLNKLEYTDCVIKESLRYNSSVPFVERCLDEDVELDGMIIPKGTNINILICAVHESDEHFNEPQKFDPSRHFPENVKERHPFTFIPFVAGPRNCIGYRYAMLLMKVALVKIVRNFEILRPLPDFELKITTHGVATSKNGFPAQFKSREMNSQKI